MLTEEQITQLRPFGFDLRTDVLVYDQFSGSKATVPAWSTVVPIHDDGSLHWPVRQRLCLVAVISRGDLRGHIFTVVTAHLSRALGHS